MVGLLFSCCFPFGFPFILSPCGHLITCVDLFNTKLAKHFGPYIIFSGNRPIIRHHLIILFIFNFGFYKIKVMQRGIASLLASAILIAGGSIHSFSEDSTNHLFRTTPYTLSPNPYLDLDESMVEFREIWARGENSKYGHELLSAAEDPGGNSGCSLTNGIQISIRFYQTDFTNGEPVPAVVLWRNTSRTAQKLDIAAGIEHYPFDLVVHRNGALQKPLTPRLDPDWRERWVGGPSPISIQPSNQIRFVLRLDKIFSLEKPGDYEITAGRDKAWSGTANFRILPQAETQTNNSPH